MVALIAIVVWRLHWLLVMVVWLPFITLDGLFLSAALTKVPDGAWFTLMLAIILSSIFVLWRYGKEKQWAAEEKGLLKLSTFVKKNEKGIYCLPTNMGGRELNPIKGKFSSCYVAPSDRLGIAIFFDKSGDGVPPVFQEFVRKFEALPEVQVLLHLRGLSRPYASDEERFEINKTALNNCYRMIVRYGYNDIVVTEGLGDLVYEKVKEFIASTPTHNQPPESGAAAALSVPVVDGERSMSSNEDDRKARRLAALDEAYSAQTVYVCRSFRFSAWLIVSRLLARSSFVC
jgi:KUP system potassium uptake protein